MSTAIKIYLKKVIAKQGIPFEMQIASEEEIKNIHTASESSLEFWKNNEDDVYKEFYKEKLY